MKMNDAILNQVAFTAHRVKTFDGTVFDKRTNFKCHPKKFAEAGFYFVSNGKDSDLVKCYVCGLEMSGWNKSSDDPWNEHVKHSPKCVYLIKKKSYDHKITIRDFVEIEKHRYLFLNDLNYEARNRAVREMTEELKRQEPVSAEQ